MITTYEFPIYGLWYVKFPALLPLIGIILMFILPWISFYKQVDIKLKLLPFFIIFSGIISAIFVDIGVLKYVLIFLTTVGLIWYLHYFYKKSKSGYRCIFFKIVLSLILPFLPLLYFHKDTFYHEAPCFNCGYCEPGFECEKNIIHIE